MRRHFLALSAAALVYFALPARADLRVPMEGVLRSCDRPLAHSGPPASVVLTGDADAAIEVPAFVESAAGVWRASNALHATSATIDERGIEVQPAESSSGPRWSLRIRATSFGRVESLHELSAPTARTAGARVELARAGFVEWFENHARGFEHGFTIGASPHGDGELWIALALDGELALRITEDGRSALCLDAAGQIRARYEGLSAFDANGRELAATLASSPAGVGIRVDDRGATYPITVDPYLSGPSWSYFGQAFDYGFGSAVSSGGDIDADGYSEILVGDFTHQVGGSTFGRVLVFRGSPSGPEALPWVTLAPSSPNTSFGFSVAFAGDVDADGYGDVVVGSFSSGEVTLYRGSPTGPVAFQTLTAGPGLQYGYSLAGAGDMNGDGFDDVIIGAPLADLGGNQEGAVVFYSGSVSGLTERFAMHVAGANVRTGHAVAGIGDFNGDGRADTAFGAPDSSLCTLNGGVGVVTLGDPDWNNLLTTSTIVDCGSNNDAKLGFSVARMGDVNGDGYADVVFGAPNHGSGAQVNEGAISALGGSPNFSFSPFLIESNQSGTNFGTSVSGVGDLNGDGYSDVAAGAPLYQSGSYQEGLVRVFLGSALGLTTPASWSFESDQADAQLGHAIACAGDVDGDGRSDLLVGIRGWAGTSATTGRASVFFGISEMPSTTPTAVAEFDQANALTGGAVALVGDVNGDGFDDVGVAASFYDVGAMGDAGRIAVYHGSAAGVPPAPSWIADGIQTAEGLGTSLAAAGDVDGDGFGDVVAGAPLRSNGHAFEGRAVLYRGSASGLSTTATLIAEGEETDVRFGAAVTGAGDVNADGFADVLVGAPRYDAPANEAGRAFLYLGSPSGLRTTPAWTASGSSASQHFGASVAGAGDIDGDGYGDVIVGSPELTNGETLEGAVYVYRGSANGLGATPWQTIEGNFPNIHWGRAVAGVGDINADGFADIAVGCPQCFSALSTEGEVWVYYGSAAGLLTASAVQGGQTGANLGWSVSSAGDVNADGFADLIAGALAYDEDFTNTGRALIYLGSSSGLASSPAWTQSPTQADANFGSAVGGGGDVNGDGFGDVIAGATNFDDPLADEGAAFVFHGGAKSSAGSANAGWKLSARQKTADGAHGVERGSQPNSTNAMRLSARCQNAASIPSTPAGRAKVRFEWEARALATPYAASGIQSSAWTDSGPVTGTPVAHEASIGGLASNTAHKWRLRAATKDPFVPRSVWRTRSARSILEPSLRTSRDCNGNGQSDVVDLIGGGGDFDQNGVIDDCESAGDRFCFGDGSSGACPCANNSSVGAEAGCLHSLGLGGKLRGLGIASVSMDTVRLVARDLPPTANTLFYQSTLLSSATAFGDGLRCATGATIRLGTRTAVDGVVILGVAGDTPIHVLGQIAGPATRYYQAWYRNAASFCTPSVFNVSSVVQLNWDG